MRRAALMLVITMNIAFNAATADEVYKWTDEKGVVHYGEFAPTNKRSQTINTPDAPPSADPSSSSDSSLERQKKQLENMTEDRINKRESKDKASKEKQEAERMCNQSKGRLALYQEGGRFRTAGPDGQVRFLSDDEVEKNLAETKKQVEKWCKK